MGFHAMFTRRITPSIASAARRSLRAIPILAGCATMLTGCGSSPSTPQAADYVAMGSSYAAGPGVTARAPGSPFLCARSSGNYAHLVAAALRLTLNDVTCSGATIDNILDKRQAFQPPQIAAIGPMTQLVTITVGGNDVGYIGNLAGESCANAKTRVPWFWRPISCSISPKERVEAAFRALPGHLLTMIDAVHARAPHARVILVDYVTVLPATGSCFARAPLTSAQIAEGNSIARRLSDATATAARLRGALLVKASEATRGHDLCSPEPWLFGFVFPSSPFTWGPFSYHPNAQAMRAVADAILTALKRPAPARMLRP